MCNMWKHQNYSWISCDIFCRSRLSIKLFFFLVDYLYFISVFCVFLSLFCSLFCGAFRSAIKPMFDNTFHNQICRPQPFNLFTFFQWHKNIKLHRYFTQWRKRKMIWKRAFSFFTALPTKYRLNRRLIKNYCGTQPIEIQNERKRSVCSIRF